MFFVLTSHILVTNVAEVMCKNLWTWPRFCKASQHALRQHANDDENMLVLANTFTASYLAYQHAYIS